MILSPPPLQPRPGLLSATVLPSARRCPVQRLHSAAKTRIGVTKQEEYNANMKRLQPSLLNCVCPSQWLALEG